MARARRDPSPPPVERPEVVRSRPTTPPARPLASRLAAGDAELLEALFGYARRRVTSRVMAEDLTVAALLTAGCGTGQHVDRAGAFRLLARAIAERPDAIADDPDGPAMALFAQALEPGLLAGFERLDLERRRVLTLHYLDRLAPPEMAAVLGTRARSPSSPAWQRPCGPWNGPGTPPPVARHGGPTPPMRPSVPPEPSLATDLGDSPGLSGPADLEARLAEAAARARATPSRWRHPVAPRGPRPARTPGGCSRRSPHDLLAPREPPPRS